MRKLLLLPARSRSVPLVSRKPSKHRRCEAREKIGWRDIQRTREVDDIHESNVALTRFNGGEVGSVHERSLR